MAKNRRFGVPEDPTSWIGQQVYKPSGKPFKSQQKVNTVSGVTTNPNTGKVAFTFEDDDSVVDANMVKLVMLQGGEK